MEKKHDWLKLIGVRKDPEPHLGEYPPEAQDTADKLLGGSTLSTDGDAGHGPEAHDCDDPFCLTKKGIEGRRAAAELLLFGGGGKAGNIRRAIEELNAAHEMLPSIDLPNVALFAIPKEEVTLSLSRDQRDMLRSIVGREVSIAGIERMAIIQHRHHLREIRGLTSESAAERLEFYDRLIGKLRALQSAIDAAR